MWRFAVVGVRDTLRVHASHRADARHSALRHVHLLQDVAAWSVWLSRYAERLGREEGFDRERRRAAMGAANPAFVLRNWVAQVSEGWAETSRNLLEMTMVHHAPRLHCPCCPFGNDFLSFSWGFGRNRLSEGPRPR